MSEKEPKLEKKAKRGRPQLKHGGFSLLTRGELPENRQYLRPYLTEAREGLIRDLGPTEEDLTAAQRILLDRVITNLGIVRLIEEYVKEKGIFQNPGGFLNPALATHYIAYNNSIRLNLQALGINKRVGDKILGPLELAAEIDREQAEQDALEAEKRSRIDQDRLSLEDTGKATDKPDGGT